MAPSFSTRSSRMTSMSRLSLFHEVREKAEVPGALDGARELALLLGRDRGDARGDDLAALGDEPLEQAHVLVIDLWRVLAGEGAGLAAAEECASHLLDLLFAVEIGDAVATVATVAATRALLVAAAHHRRRAVFELVDADRE